ncbi:D-alanine--D-alanine ligase [Deltaproteobacteria bacterium Smac51]|nr:D-alanine--D-alanine ligase [Deltaproteobacteria bacterium Smac51]
MGVRIGVFFGGKTVEHEVSIISGIQAINSFSGDYDITPVYITREGDMYSGPDMARVEEYRDVKALLAKSQRVICVNNGGRFLLQKYPGKFWGNPVYKEIDVAFPIVHGTNVEDGALQGFFKTLSIPFVGPDVAASAVGMDKYFMKTILKDNGIPVLDCRRVFVKSYFRETDKIISGIEAAYKYPMIVKPLNLGSSIGIKKAFDSAGLREAFEYAFQYTNIALVEEAVSNLKEINCAVLGDLENAEASECEEPINTDLILSYEDKYISGDKSGSKGMSGAKRKLPADISPELREEVRELAVRTFQALDCNGVSRIDFLMDTVSEQVWVNEINTIPGSLSFYLWEPLGLSYSKLLERLVELALKRERENADISYSFETNILANYTGSGAKGLKGGKH